MGKGSGIATRAEEEVARSRIVWSYLVINQSPGENFREGKVGRNNSTKIDNPIFGVLQTFPPYKNLVLEIRRVSSKPHPLLLENFRTG